MCQAFARRFITIRCHFADALQIAIANIVTMSLTVEFIFVDRCWRHGENFDLFGRYAVLFNGIGEAVLE